MDYIKQKLALVPNLPGSYQMKNKDGVIIYVGKAKKLKNRLSSYFRGTHTGKTAKLVSEIVDFEYVVVNNEMESLILEQNLIKKYDPKYNILLRDDKTYPYIELTKERVPRLLVVRNVNRKRKNTSRLYGPYPNVTEARNVVNLLNRLYPLRKCTTYNKKPCLYYHIGQCLGYCSNKVDTSKIKEMEEEIVSFLKGNDKVVTDKLEKEMMDEASKLNFEKAKEYKDLLDSISTTLNKQTVELNDTTDRDVFGYYVNKGYICIQVLFIRSGKVQKRHYKIFDLVDDIEEEFNKYIISFYDNNVLIPKEILGPDILNISLLEEYLGCSVKVPLKGIKKDIVNMASDNAKVSLDNKFELIQRDEKRTVVANNELREILNLDILDRIELFDNSNLFGSYNVSGMVVFVDGKPSKNDYRKFKISVDKNDDYGTMREVIYRRYFKVLMEDLKRPNLIIVDGAVGQMNIAREVLRQLNLNIPVVGLKKDDKHTTNALLAFDPIIEIPIDKRSNLFYYLERMQDEVHNFTINYHKQLRSKGSLGSILENIEGIGAKRKIELLKKYKTITKLSTLTVKELSEILPENVANNLYEFLKEYNKK